jgi:hypothetical protein
MGRAVPSPLLGLAPGGGYLAARVATSAGGLLYHLFTLTPSLALSRVRGRERVGAVCFSVALFRRVTHLRCAPAWALPSTVPCGARTFLAPHKVWDAIAWPTWVSTL